MAHTEYPPELGDLDPNACFDVECARLDRHFATMADSGGWDRPSACPGWSVADVLAHLLHSLRYDVACLDDRIADLFAEAASAGVTDLQTFNDWGVRLGRARNPEEVLGEWRERCAEVRRRFRERGRQSTIPTMVGQYSTGLQVLHLAFEQSIHADDVGAAVADAERESRADWRVRFLVWSLANEKEGAPSVERAAGVIRVAGEQLDDDRLVAAASGRLPASDPLPEELRASMNMYA